MEMPIISLTDPKKQLEIAGDFCTMWNGPIKFAYGEKPLIMMPYDFYLKNFCTPEEAQLLSGEISAKAATLG